MQRTCASKGFVGGIEPVRFFERVGIDRDQRIDMRSLLVEGCDAVQIHLHDVTAGELAGLVSGVNIVNGRFNNSEMCLSHGGLLTRLPLPAAVCVPTSPRII